MTSLDRYWKTKDLFQCLVVDEAGGILGDLELPLLNMLAKLPVESR